MSRVSSIASTSDANAARPPNGPGPRTDGTPEASAGEVAAHIRVLLVSDPGLPHELALQIAPQLPWEVCVSSVRLPADDGGKPQAPSGVRRRKRDLVVLLTDVPRGGDAGPVVAEVDRSGGTGLVSLPSLGALRLRRRATAAVTRVIQELAGPASLGPLGPFARQDDDTVSFVATAAFGRLRVLAGMVRANRPWRLLPHLSKAFAAALATLAYAIVNPTIWQLAAQLGGWRLAVSMLLAISTMVVWLIVNHGMWERPTEPSERERAAQFNAATVTTLLIGVLFLYAGLVAVGLLADRVVLVDGVMESETSEKVTLATHLAVVWLSSSIATVAGALGTGFESDEAVRQAAYGFRQRERRESSISG